MGGIQAFAYRAFEEFHPMCIEPQESDPSCYEKLFPIESWVRSGAYDAGNFPKGSIYWLRLWREYQRERLSGIENPATEVNESINP